MRINANKRYDWNFWLFSYVPIKKNRGHYCTHMLTNKRTTDVLYQSVSTIKELPEVCKYMKSITKGNSINKVAKMIRNAKREKFRYVD